MEIFTLEEAVQFVADLPSGGLPAADVEAPQRVDRLLRTLRPGVLPLVEKLLQALVAVQDAPPPAPEEAERWSATLVTHVNMLATLAGTLREALMRLWPAGPREGEPR